jgi:hypothetical protein
VSTNPLQRIADLEAQVASLTAENNSLRSRTNGNGNGHFDADRLLDAIGQKIDRSGYLMREDFTGKLAALIAPYLKETMRECEEVREQQDELEKKFEEHKKAVAGSAAQMEASFVKMRKEAAKDWKAQRDLIQEDLGRVDSFSKWFHAELLKNAQGNNAAVASCNLAAQRCQEAASKVSAPTEEVVKHLEALRSKGEESIKRAERSVTEAHDAVHSTVLKLAGVMLAAAILLQAGFGIFISGTTGR